jgi:hypothetical protein
MKTNQIDVVAFTMFSHLEQIEHPEETRLACQRRSNIGKPDQCDRINLDLSLSHPITLALFYAGAHPNSNAAGYFPSNHSFAEALCENHRAAPFLALAYRGDMIPVVTAPIEGRGRVIP